MNIRYAERARRDLARTGAYLYRRNPATADRVGHAIRRCIERLATFPLSGRLQISSERIRKVVVPAYGYLVYYRVDPEEIMILMIRHQAQKRVFDDR